MQANSRTSGEEHGSRLTLIMVADVPQADVATFRDYEARVLPFLTRYGGVLERRLQSEAGTFEAHLISFDNRTGYENYLADPRRAAARRLLDGSALQQRVVMVHDVPADDEPPASRDGVEPDLDPVVADVAAQLLAAQDRVRVCLADADEDGWARCLDPLQRDDLRRRGHFPEYGHELAWTAQEVAGHLSDSAQIFADRIDRLRSSTDPTLTDFVTDDPVRIQRYRTQPAPALLEELEIRQRELHLAVLRVGSDELDHRGHHSVDGEISLAMVLGFLPQHQRDHAAQLEALLNPAFDVDQIGDRDAPR